jgi:hypothetical protein
VPAAIYIILQHLLASIVKSRLAARFGDIDSLQAAGTGSSGPAASRGHSIFKSVTVIVTSESMQNCGRSGCGDEFQCPFHAASLWHPTTLHPRPGDVFHESRALIRANQPYSSAFLMA